MPRRLLSPLLVLAASVMCAPVAQADNREILQRELDRLTALTVPEPVTPGAWQPRAGLKPTLQMHERMLEWGYHTQDEAALAAALRTFQRANGLAETGTLNAATRARLSLDRGARIERLRQRLAAEDMRPVDWTAERFVVVNIPAFQLHAFEGGLPVIESPVVVGRPQRPTPEMAVNMRAIKYNPTWTPPPTIIKEDLIPLLSRDPSAITRRGLVVLGPGGRQVAPEGLGGMSVNGFHAAGYKLFQPAGERNALGRLKFEITSTDSVYLHDTNHRNDFGKPMRALSSGCVRVQRYLPLAAWLMGRDEAAIEARIGKGRTLIEPAPQIPVHLVYWLADVREGQVVYFGDVYARLGRPAPEAPARPLPEPPPTQVAGSGVVGVPASTAGDAPAFGRSVRAATLGWSDASPFLSDSAARGDLPTLH